MSRCSSTAIISTPFSGYLMPDIIPIFDYVVKRRERHDDYTFHCTTGTVVNADDNRVLVLIADEYYVWVDEPTMEIGLEDEVPVMYITVYNRTKGQMQDAAWEIGCI